ncbi:AraC family ligand binding domain-containing protein [Micromonospora sp. C81]|uniref:AraC family ligand binding domain-containing protein n=1 Tax=Micromonospora sp. C81 TaxID=2824881 RepID=UPI0027E0069E|nr:AraC family ligand binding domain-containing protein [Micromonospora sp. C81]
MRRHTCIEVHTLHKGDALFVPPNIPHAFAPADGQDADFHVVITPGKPRFDYYRLLALHAAAGDSSRRMSRAEMGVRADLGRLLTAPVRRLLFRQVEQVPMSAIDLSASS